MNIKYNIIMHVIYRLLRRYVQRLTYGGTSKDHREHNLELVLKYT
jgi:hypothetical protein